MIIYLSEHTNIGLLKEDFEITDSTYSLYTNLSADYTPLLFDDGTVGLKK